MRQVNYIPFLKSPEFKAWLRRSRKARSKILASGKPANFNQAIWADLKQILIDLNNEKCMYCEGQYLAGSHDDAEHYRPKGEVTEWDEAGEVRRKVVHPGYYWLAYEWQNILLACTKCNSAHPAGGCYSKSCATAHVDGTHGPHPGKAIEFPLAVGSNRCANPGPTPNRWWKELKAEEPLLLHPYFDRCDEHFAVAKFGVIYGITPRVEPRCEHATSIAPGCAAPAGTLRGRFARMPPCCASFI